MARWTRGHLLSLIEVSKRLGHPEDCDIWQAELDKLGEPDE